jgi:hypothetical protein
MDLEQRVSVLEAIVVSQQGQIRSLQANAPRPAGKRKETRAKPRVSPLILQALDRHFRIVPEAVDITELTANEIIETLEYKEGVRLGATPHVKSIVIARALAEFGAIRARSSNRRFYRGIVRKSAQDSG